MYSIPFTIPVSPTVASLHVIVTPFSASKNTLATSSQSLETATPKSNPSFGVISTFINLPAWAEIGVNVESVAPEITDSSFNVSDETYHWKLAPAFASPSVSLKS